MEVSNTSYSEFASLRSRHVLSGQEYVPRLNSAAAHPSKFTRTTGLFDPQDTLDGSQNPLVRPIKPTVLSIENGGDLLKFVKCSSDNMKGNRGTTSVVKTRVLAPAGHEKFPTFPDLFAQIPILNCSIPRTNGKRSAVKKHKHPRTENTNATWYLMVGTKQDIDIYEE
mmetsp:Transcript_101741/g.164022  ORF Transcript_101741/g.164022 Transcript_101741/m.164022 type:complete len:168 (+) Transcript_101741:2468-2971(+)